jgi:hypothetical protein
VAERRKEIQRERLVGRKPCGVDHFAVIYGDLWAFLDVEGEEGDVVILPLPIVPLLEREDELLGSRRNAHLLHEFADGGIARRLAATEVSARKTVVGHVRVANEEDLASIPQRDERPVRHGMAKTPVETHHPVRAGVSDLKASVHEGRRPHSLTIAADAAGTNLPADFTSPPGGTFDPTPLENPDGSIVQGPACSFPEGGPVDASSDAADAGDAESADGHD